MNKSLHFSSNLIPFSLAKLNISSAFFIDPSESINLESFFMHLPCSCIITLPLISNYISMCAEVHIFLILSGVLINSLIVFNNSSSVAIKSLLNYFIFTLNLWFLSFFILVFSCLEFVFLTCL